MNADWCVSACDFDNRRLHVYALAFTDIHLRVGLVETPHRDVDIYALAFQKLPATRWYWLLLEWDCNKQQNSV